MHLHFHKNIIYPYSSYDMEEYLVKTVVFSVILWTTLFVVIRKLVLPHRSFDFSNRIVSTLHASAAVLLASLTVQNWTCPVCPLNTTPSPHQMQTVAVTIGYLIYDLGCGQFEKKVKVDNVIHHIVSIVGLLAGLSYKRCGSEMVASLWITEISSPFLHLRELLKELGYKNTNLNLAVDIAFAAIFTIARMILGPCLVYLVLSVQNPLIITSMTLGMQIVSAFWFYKIARMMAYKLGRKSTSTKTE